MTQAALNLEPGVIRDDAQLAAALRRKTGRDLFAGVEDRGARQAAARIAIVMNRLEAEFGADYERVYGEPLPKRQRLEKSA